VQFRQCAILQYSKTPARNASRSDAGGPSLRSPGFEDEDDDEDENEAPHEHLQPATRVQFRGGASNWVHTPFLQATTFEHEHERRTPNVEREAPGEGAAVGRAFSAKVRQGKQNRDSTLRRVL
jgi:hypothetical protein